MKQVFNTYEKVEDAIIIVRELMKDGISAYRQGFTVFVDDGGVDDAI